MKILPTSILLACVVTTVCSYGSMLISPTLMLRKGKHIEKLEQICEQLLSLKDMAEYNPNLSLEILTYLLKTPECCMFPQLIEDIPIVQRLCCKRTRTCISKGGGYGKEYTNYGTY